jgi:hypothetical protein
MIDPAINTGWFEIVKATNKSETSIQDLFHNTLLARYQNLSLLSLTIWANLNVSSNKCVCKTIMALKPNQLQVITHRQMQSLSNYTKLSNLNNMLRSFDLENENNHENLEQQEDNPFDYFLQSTAWAIRNTYHTTLQATPCQLVFGRDMIHNVAFRANWDKIKKKTGHYK